jgi:hypothetical protein
VLEIAWDGNLPQLTSPEGESHRPASAAPLWRGSRAQAYSPFSAPPGSSRDFVAWQLSRAVRAVYGASIPAGEIAERCLVTGADGTVLPKQADLSLRAEFPQLRPAGAGPLFPALTTLVCVPWLVLVTLLLRLYRPGVSHRVRQAAVWATVALIVVTFAGFAAAVMTGWVRFWIVELLAEIPIRKLGGSLPATLAVWAVGMALLAAAYELSRSMFARMEIPARPTRFTMIEYLRGEE